MRKLILGLVALATLFVLIYVGVKYRAYTSANVPHQLEDPYLLIPEGADFKTLLDSLQAGGFLKEVSSFREMARLKGLNEDRVRNGRYRIEPGWSNRHLVNHLLAGEQATVKLVLNSARLLEDVAARASRYLEVDSLSILSQISDPEVLQAAGYTPEQGMCIFIPNTYDFFWNTSPAGFLQRMQREQERFWERNDRLAKAKELGLSPCEVSTLASIVEKETIVADERPRVAGLYLNRLKRGMLLQADPTAVFATRDFTARRVLDRHTQFDSPYNTYLYKGLPPGPICMPSISSIDAVLNAEEHNYLYMCAKPDNSGRHAFAKTLAGHNRNAARYRRWLNQRGIK